MNASAMPAPVAICSPAITAMMAAAAPWADVIGATTPTLPWRSELYTSRSPVVLPIAVTMSSATCSRPRPSGTPCASANGAEITEPISSTHPSTATGGIIRVDRLMHSAEAAHIAAATRPPTIAITGRARLRAQGSARRSSDTWSRREGYAEARRRA